MHYQQKPTYVFALAAAMVATMSVLLAAEWIKVRRYAYELIELKQDYQAYVQLLRRKMPDVCDDNCLLSCDEVLINRDFSYLRSAALSFASQEDALLDQELTSIYVPYDFGLNTGEEKNKSTPAKPNARNVVVQRAVPVPQPVRGQSLLSWPVDKGLFWLSSFFGPRKKPDGSPGFHLGIDLAAVRGTSVKAAAAGLIIEAGYTRGYGNTIVIVHNKKYKTRYAHLDKIMVKRNQKVDREQLIGTVGNTGLVRSDVDGDPSHLHFEVYVFGKRVNPRKFLP